MDDQQKIAISHAYLNALNAHLQGRYTRLNILKRLDAGVDNVDDLLRDTVELLERVRTWFADVFKGEFIDFRADTLSTEADLIVELIPGIISELNSSAEQIQTLVELPIESVERVHSIDLVSYVALQAYAREHYIKGLIAYGQAFNMEEVVDRWSQHILSCQQAVNDANTYFGLLEQNKDESSEVFLNLQTRYKNLARTFFAMANDFAQLSGL